MCAGLSSSMYPVVLLAAVCLVGAQPDPLQSLEFLKKFGYLEEQDGGAAESLYSDVSIEAALKEVQRFGNIPQTGRLDNRTLQLMKSQRCGVADILRDRPEESRRLHSRNKRYIIGSQGWNKRHLTYYLGNWSPKMRRDAVIEELSRAMQTWGSYGRLYFSEASDPGSADIVIGFYRGSHGDLFPFDGRGSVLAHAYYPTQWGSYGGDIHFDDDEDWKINPGPFDEGVDFSAVALHELGHSLGLSHTPEPDSVMNPYYKGNNGHRGLGRDDILGMHHLYISRRIDEETPRPTHPTREPYTTQRSTTRHTTRRSTREPDTRISTTTTRYTRKPTRAMTTVRTPYTTRRFFSTREHSTTVPTTKLPYTSKPSTDEPFTTPHVRTTPTGDDKSVSVSYHGDDESVETHKGHDDKHRIPAPESPLDPGCYGNFDAAAYIRGELFIIKNQSLWRLPSPGVVEEGYPVELRRFFHKLPDEIIQFDALLQREFDSSIIIFSGKKYWVFDGYDFIEGSPKPITDYGLPPSARKVDAAMTWKRNSKTYIFSGEYFWRYDESKGKVDDGYPRFISKMWNVPGNLDAALTDEEGITYFFKNDDYWAMDNMKVKPLPDYPKSASDYWIGC